MRKGNYVVFSVLLVLLSFPAQSQSNVQTFMESGYTTFQVQPPGLIDENGYIPVIQGYPLCDYDEDEMLIQVMQTSVQKGSQVAEEVQKFQDAADAVEDTTEEVTTTA